MESNDNGQQNHAFSRRGYWKWLMVLPLAVAGIYVARADAFGGFDHLSLQHKEKMQPCLDKVFEEVKATPSQQTAIKAIAERMHSEMEPLLQKHHSLHEKLTQAFSGQTVDVTTINLSRDEAKALFDRGTQILTTALVDIGNVLDMEQRQKVLQFIQQQHGRHHFNFFNK